MRTSIEGAPSFAYVHVDLDPGESIVAESDAMASMDADLDLRAALNGGWLGALTKRLLGGEALFVSVFTNNTARPRRVTLARPSPGDIKALPLAKTAVCLRPGAFLASTPGVRLAVRWAGLASWLARAGLFKLQAKGEGTVWIGAYGGLVLRSLSGAHVVDGGHLVAYEPQIRLRPQVAGGFFGSLFSGEGLVTRLEGRGRFWVQTRSLAGLRDYLNPRLP